MVLNDRVEREEFERLRTACQLSGGWYSRQWGIVPGGFAWKERAKAEEFARKHVNGNEPPTGGGIPIEKLGETDIGKANEKSWEATRIVKTIDELAGGMRLPSAQREAVAAELEAKAESMEVLIDSKINSGTSKQYPTPRRMRIAENMRHEGERLIKVQKALRALAEAWRRNDVPTSLAGVRTKSRVEELVREKNVALLALTEKSVTAEDAASDAARKAEKELRDLENEARFSDMPGFFPTPPAVIEKMLEAAQIEPGQSVLEPSAGIGHIAFAVAAENVAGHITTIEIVPKFVDIIRRKADKLGIDSSLLSVVCVDFMATWKISGGTYDRILMNPPFERGHDCEHVKHAYGLLKAGGRLVAIMSNGAKSNGDEFAEWLDSVGAIVEPLEPGAFKSAFRPTGVNCKLVVIDK